jgi:hypothetical protein
MPQYFLVDDGASMPRWCEIGVEADQTFWIDFKARRRPFAQGRPLAVVECENHRALLATIPAEVAQMERDAAVRHLLDPWSEQGWISPTGRFYGCRFYAHDDLAYALLRRSVEQLEGAGWVRVHADSYRTSQYFGREISAAQVSTLLALGFPEPGSFAMRGRWVPPDRDAPPPRYAYAPTAALERPPAPAPSVVRPLRGGVSEDALRAFAGTLANEDFFRDLLREEPRLITRIGRGRWKWMLEFDAVHVGSCEPPEVLAASPGLYVSAPAGDQLELEEWPHAGVEVCPAAQRIMDACVVRASAPGP